MKTNWLKTVNEINSKRFVIPDGWETRDQVAASLQCDPSKVGDILKPGVASGEIDRQTFPVWDAARRMAVSVVCYRMAGEGPKKPSKPSRGHSGSLEERIEAAILRYPSHSNHQIAKNVRGVTSSDVERIRCALA
jgi:hypothetical protein